MESSIFTEKSKRPEEEEIKTALGRLYKNWTQIREFVLLHSPGSKEEWNYSKIGWNARIKDSKRVIIYFMPRKSAFKVSFVFGEKATAEALKSDISDSIKSLIKSAPVYGEGRGFRIPVMQRTAIKDIEKLILIKKAF